MARLPGLVELTFCGGKEETKKKEVKCVLFDDNLCYREKFNDKNAREQGCSM